MDGAVGFSASNRSRIDSPRSSDSRLVMLYKGVKIQPSLGGIFSCGIWMFLACGTTTRSAMVKQMVQADSAHQIGLKPTLHTILIVVESGDTRGQKARGIFHHQKFGNVLLVAQQPEVLWGNGDHSKIQCVK